jgi:Tol biopolymer transport system component
LTQVVKQLALVVAGLVAVLLIAGQLARATAGPGPNDPQDSLPAWSSDGARVLFERTSRTSQHVLVVPAGHGAPALVTDNGLLRGVVPHTSDLLIQLGTTTLVSPVRRFEGTDASASPDGARLAYLRGGTLYVSTVDGTSEHAIASGIAPPSSDVTGPVWSPDGSRIAVASGSSLVLVQADGSSQRAIATVGTANDNPSWSPDGTTIAFERDTGKTWEIWTAAAGCDFCASPLINGAATNNRFPQFSPFTNMLAFISDRQHARGGATPYQFALYVRDLFGVTHKLVDDVHPYSAPRWSPTAALIAVSAGQECRRFGVYVTRPDAGSHPHRRSNLCRFDGTAGADMIKGSPYFDRIDGLGGNDTIYGGAGSDAISGNGGNDTIYGGPGNDFIFGGPGDDRILGGAGNDTIIGGNGVDRIDCGPGIDTVEAAGPRDIVARDCEHVLR